MSQDPSQRPPVSQRPPEWTLSASQRRRSGKLTTRLYATNGLPGCKPITCAYIGPIDASGLAALLRVMARRVERDAPEIE